MTACTVARSGSGAPATARAVGVLRPPEAARFQRALEAVLRSKHAVLLDVTDLRLAGTDGVAVFSRALLAAGGWPTVRLVLVGGGGRLAAALRRTRAGHDVLVAPDAAQARARLADRPDRVRRRTGLPVAAGAFVDAACRDWAVPGLADRARPVAARLTRQAAPPGVLTVSLDGAGLRIAVRTFGPHAASGDDRLRSVRGLGHACGTAPRSDGTSVWALVAGT